jgi:ATP synthase protein I
MALDREPRKAGRNDTPDASQYAGVGIQFAAGILLFTFAGRWLDGRLGTSPWLLLLGVMLGFALSTFWIYRQLVVRPRERARDGREDGP